MGFFTQQELKQKGSIVENVDLLTSSCLECGMSKHSKHPKIDVAGEGKKQILIIGEYSTEEEDLLGTAFAGESGEFLAQKLRFYNISLQKDCWRVNAVRCKKDTGGFDPPSHKQIKNCHPHIRKLIKSLKPKLILLMGSVAITSLYADEFSDRSVLRWRGYNFQDQEFNCNITALYPPSYLLRFNKDKNLHCLFDRDLKKAVSSVDKIVKNRVEYSSYVRVLKDFKQVKNVLGNVLKRKSKIAFDYETTGLKPFKLGHKIATIGFAVSETKAFVFPFQWKDHWTEKEFKEIKTLWQNILAEDEIKKIMHNAKYEEIWSTVICNKRPKCFFDTMMCEHILDNRSHSTGLKFQSFVRYGVRPYDKLISPFLESTDDSEFNNIFKAPLNELLLYNGLDCIFCFKMYRDQIGVITKRHGLLKAYNFFQKGNRQMATLQLNGINMNSPYYVQAEKDLEQKIEERKKYLSEGREARAFQKKFNRPILLTSNQDLGKLFYEILGKSPIYTSGGVNYRTDKSTLEGLDLPFVKKLLEMKKYEKAKGTYLGQFAREVYKGKMYPFYDLNLPVSYRSSSSRPNFQNLPKRDKEIKSLIRKGIVPKKGCVLSEVDFSGAEVLVSACYHKDKNFIAYLKDKTTDMHRDVCMDLLLLPHSMLENKEYDEEQKSKVKMLRFFAKNCWTFAQFYGDWYGSCAPTFWEAVVDAGLLLPNGMSCKDWLESKGIYELGEIDKGRPTSGSFMEHCKAVEEKMWNERFPEYTQWRKDIVTFYQTYGYIETYFGFRFTGLMSKNQCTNFPIQGTSFHLLVYTLIQVQDFINKNKLKTKLVGQIHDSCLANVPKDEIAFYHSGVNKIVKELKNKFDWLVVPMEIEAEISKLREDGGNFSEMKEINPDDAKLWYS